MYKDSMRMSSQETLFHAGLNCPNIGTFQKAHEKISDEKNERNKNWDKHSGNRAGGKEKKDDKPNFTRRNPPKKKKDDSNK